MKPAHAQAWSIDRLRPHLLITLITLGLVSGTSTTHAHAIVLESHPAVNASIDSTETNFDLRFNSRIDKHRSRVRIARPDATMTAISAADASAADRLIGRIPVLPPGTYRLEWQVLGADGHITRGYIPFKVVSPNH